MNETIKGRVKVITSHVGVSRFQAECDQTDDDIFAGYIPRQPQIPSPYAYSPTHVVYRYKGQPVIIVETSHKRYEVFAVEPSAVTDEATAEQAYLQSRRVQHHYHGTSRCESTDCGAR